jgi:type IV secretory pathway VirJ component
MKKIALLVLLLVATLASAANDQSRVSAGRLLDIPLYAPPGTPSAAVIYVSDRTGWSSDDDTRVAGLVGDGNMVLAVDLARYAVALDADPGACLYVVGELTDLAQKAQRQLGIQSYLYPIVVGSGEGATFAYAAIADAPPNTLGGAVAMDFRNHVGLRLPSCPGPTAKPDPSGGFSYAFDVALPEPVELYVRVDRFADFAARAEHIANLSVEALQDGNNSEQLIAAVRRLGAKDTPFGQLPVIDLPASGAPSALAIFVSGDGGWRDLDKTMGEWMAGKGVHVVGVDALRYFWSERTARAFAADIEKMVARADATGALPIMLIGYSFGADTLPLAWPHLSTGVQNRTRMVALLGPGRDTGLQITVAGWLGLSAGAFPVVPAIVGMPTSKVLCVYGLDDGGSACPDHALADVKRIATKGGHHFDGDYPALGAKLLTEFEGRAAN